MWVLGALAAARITVFLFLADGCPLSERYRPEIDRLRADYSPRGVAFVLSPPIDVARALGATVTPQAVVETGGRVVYRGRIDDRAIAIGRMRPGGPTRHDLRIALDELLAGRPVSVPETTAVGCAIPLPTRTRGPAPTFARDVAPILFKHCAECHRPGEAGPFPLLTYADAQPRAAAIHRVTADRIMPPWQPDPGPPHFLGERRLTPAEINTLRRWAQAGAPEGDSRHTPTAPVFPSAWRLGEPDLVVRMPRPVAIPAEGPDLYQCFVIPLNLPSSRWVRAFEFLPGNRSVLHHALIFSDATGAARRRDAETPGDGYPCFGVPGFLPSASLGGWTPGNTPIPYPESTAVPLRRGADLVLQLHYHPTGKPAEDQSAVALYFTEQPPRRRMMDVALGSRLIDIPPGEANYRVTDHFTLPVDVLATGIIPHAHYICREMRGRAILPNGRRINLLTIRNWDFNWQQHYRYRSPFRLPADTRLEMEFIYDNSSKNPRNPFSPPRRIRWGPDSTDEMAGLHLQVVLEDPEAIRELGQSLWGKIMRELGGGIFSLPAVSEPVAPPPQ